MNTKQKIVVVLSSIILSLSILFPPWIHNCPNSIVRSAGYSFIATPPEAKNVCPSSGPDSDKPSIQFDAIRWATQAIIVLALASALALNFANSERINLKRVISAFLYALGAIGVMFFGLLILFEI